MTEDDVTDLARTMGRLARRRGVTVATAESCTGGGVATAITRISGSAKWFERGFVTYTNTAKKEMLGVSGRTLDNHGAVSEQVAVEMAQGALAFSHADVAVAITGIAGPTGGSRKKPVGLVHFAWAARGEPIPCVITAMADEFGGEIPVGPFALIGGDEIGRGIVTTLTGHRSPAVLMRSHGVFTIGPTAHDAGKAAVMCEDVARTVHLARAYGDPQPLAQDQVDALHRRYQEEYGQR